MCLPEQCSSILKYKTAYIFSANSRSASDGVTDPWCLIYLDSGWSGSKPIQTPGPEIWAREGGCRVSEMRALKWNMKSSQSEWVPLATPYRTEARGDLKPHSACEEAHSPWASHLNQSLGLDVLISPALFIGSCAWHLREKKATVSQKPSWKLSTINKNLPSPESIIKCPGPTRHLPCTYMLRQPLLHEWRNSEPTCIQP